MFPSYNPKTKITLSSQVSSFFGAHPSKSCGISGQDTSFLLCLCVYLPINASWCLDSQRIASSLTLSQKTNSPGLGESNNPLNSLLYLSMTLMVLWCLEQSYVQQRNMYTSQTLKPAKLMISNLHVSPPFTPLSIIVVEHIYQFLFLPSFDEVLIQELIKHSFLTLLQVFSTVNFFSDVLYSPFNVISVNDCQEIKHR